MFDIKRQDGETEEQLLYRIGQQKEENNLTWKDIADIMNELLDYNHTECKYRKQFAKLKKFFNDNNFVENNDQNKITELEKLRNEIKSERVKLQTLNLERNRINREDARQELFYEQIGQYINYNHFILLKIKI